MKKITTLLSILFLATLSVNAQWKLDVPHSNLGFSIQHLGVSYIKGSVVMKEATINASDDNFTNATVRLVADMNTIDTDNEKRDAHLKTADFFDTTKFPEIIFESTSMTKGADGKFVLEGKLSLHGITKPITLSAEIKTITSPINNKPLAGIKVMGTIKRSDFNISASTPVEILSDETAIEANLEFQKP